MSLVEILVAVAIVAILLVLALPLSKSLNQARYDTQCISNLRQLSVAAQSYIADNNGILRSMEGGNDISWMWTRMLLLGGYLNPDVHGGTDNDRLLRQIDSVGSLLRCPKGEVGPAYSREFPARWIWQTYGMGMFDPEFEIRPALATKYTGIYEAPLSRISKPSSYILFADSATTQSNLQQSFRISRTAGSGGVALRHNKRAHVVFLDGHTESVDRERLEELKVPNFNIFDVKQ
jgi:prepilin-type processing-associated H-X9-DG protein